MGRSEEFEAAISSPERGALADFCAAKSGAAQSEDEAEAWAFMRVLFQDDPRRCGVHVDMLELLVYLLRSSKPLPFHALFKRRHLCPLLLSSFVL